MEWINERARQRRKEASQPRITIRGDASQDSLVVSQYGYSIAIKYIYKGDK
jgi:hypothetical protein